MKPFRDKIFANYLSNLSYTDVLNDFDNILKLCKESDITFSTAVKCLDFTAHYTPEQLDALLKVMLSKTKDIYDLHWIIDTLISYDIIIENNNLLLEFISSFKNRPMKKSTALVFARSNDQSKIMQAAENYFYDSDIINIILDNDNLDEEILCFLFTTISEFDVLKKIILHPSMSLSTILLFLDRVGNTELFDIIVKKTKRCKSCNILK